MSAPEYHIKPPKWADPNDSDKIDRTRYREPDGYELVEWTGLVSAVVFTGTMSLIVASQDNPNEARLKELQDIQIDLTEKVEAFWERLEKDNTEGSNPEVG